jgi:aromatic ring-opening dioxygenase catalytic subunit (LigB family)
MNGTSTRMPTIFLPHGGGPWPFLEVGGFADARETRALADYLAGIPAQLPQRPKAMVVISAHWEEPVPTVMTNVRPPMLYDYSGFPPETYRLQWPAPGAPALAARVRGLLEAAGQRTAEDERRGFDHGTFVPLMLTFPKAEVPAIQLSLQAGLDPARHLAIGRALAPLRDEGILIVGSGMSYHNMRGFGRETGRAHSEIFDQWLRGVVVASPAARDEGLGRWSTAPSARDAHPREEHLLPLMVVAGAAGTDPGRVAYSDTFAQTRITAVHFGS